jgi:type II secretory pathway component GspD/PulD (secretin)
MKPLALILMLTVSAAAAAAEKTVTLDVKNAEVRDILQSLKQQCGVKNMVIDPDVKGEGARIIFKEVPCSTAFRVVLRQFNLAGQFDTTITTVEPRR